MFEDLLKKVEEEEAKKSVNMVETDFSEDISLNIDALKETILNMSSLSDDELRQVLKTSYGYIIDDIMYETDAEYIKAFTDKRFLQELIKILNTVTLEPDRRICCNKLAYDYITSNSEDSYVKQLLFTMSKIVNKDKVPILMGFGIPEEFAVHMALSRYSSRKETINVRRLNFVIATTPKDFIDIQRIVNIYETLFDAVTPIFEGTMFDVFDATEEWVTEDILDIYSMITIAVLDILSNMPKAEIRKVLVSYANDYEYIYNRDYSKIRFSLRSIADDFIRVIEVVEALDDENIYVP